MAAIATCLEDDCLDEILERLQSCFESQSDLKNLVDGVKSAIFNLRSGVVLKKTREVADLVLAEASVKVTQKNLNNNFPAGVTIGNIEEMLKLIYAGSGTENLKKAIDFVQIVDESLQVGAYKALYEDIQFKKHTGELEMLLLNSKLTQLTLSSAAEIKCLVDEDCNKICCTIAEDIKNEDYSFSSTILENFGIGVLNSSFMTIVARMMFIHDNTLEDFLLLIKYSQELIVHKDSQGYLLCTIETALHELELFESEHALHLWAHARFASQNYLHLKIKNSIKSWDSTNHYFCNVDDRLSSNKNMLLQYYQKYVEDSNKQKITEVHERNYLHMWCIVPDFVSFYYNGEVGRTNHLLASARAINNFNATGLMLSELRQQMIEKAQMNTFEAFRIFNEVKHKMNDSKFDQAHPDEKILFETMRNKAPLCLRQLLWQDKKTSGFQIVNKFFNATLCAQKGSKYAVCISTSDVRSKCFWRVTVNSHTSMLTLTYSENDLSLDFDWMNTSYALLEFKGARGNLMVKHIDEIHVKIFSVTNGVETFLTAEGKGDGTSLKVCFKKENNTDMQLWKVQPN